MVEVEKDYANKGVAGAGLGLGIAGTALGLLGNGGIPGLLGGCNNNWNNGCSENMMVNRYEASQSARIAELETEVKLRDANAYTLSLTKLVVPNGSVCPGWGDVTVSITPTTAG